MKLTRIYTKNAAYQKFEVLKTNRNKRHKFNQFFVEGVKNINEAIKNSWPIVSFIYSFERKLSSWATDILNNVITSENFELTDELMSEISSKEDTSELLAIIEMRDDSLLEIKLSKVPFIALFDRPSNKGNLGTIIRSCDAIGVDGLIITGHAVDLYDKEVIAASMGSFFKIPVIRVAENKLIDDYICYLKMKYEDLKVVGTTAHKETNIYDLDLTKPVLMMLGNETVGLNSYLKSLCTDLATIPMSEHSAATSFNVACAATVLFYEVIRQRLL